MHDSFNREPNPLGEQIIMQDQIPPSMEMDMERLLRTSLKQILGHEDFDAFLGWMRKNLAEFLPAEMPISELTGEALGQMASTMARMIWNVTPLPGNDFRPAPRPLPGRNEPCHCGSGMKYKQCCAKVPALGGMDEEGIWHLMVDHLPAEDLTRAVERKKIPRAVLLSVAERYVKQDEPHQTVALLEPFFAGKIGKTDQELAEYAFDMLADTYDKLGREDKKTALIDHILNTAPRGPLRSTAWQRKACILADQGRQSVAWEAYRKAMRDDPESLGLCIVELHLLMVEGKWDQASDRARFWHARISKLAVNPDQVEPLLGFLQKVIDNPRTAMDILMDDILDHQLDEASMAALDRLGVWVESVLDRPLPRYSCREPTPLDPEDDKEIARMVEHKLKEMGIARSERDGISREIAEAARNQGLLESLGDDEGEDAGGEDAVGLAPPSAVKKVEKKWTKVFPMEKPFSTIDLPYLDDQDDSVWDPDVFPLWMQVLEDNPQCFDSLSILDDLVLAATILAEEAPYPRLATIIDPLLDRGLAIMKSLSLEEGVPLPWMITENRPGLRCLVHAVQRAESRENFEEAEDLATYYLRLNPDDTHGLRADLMTRFLVEEENEKALGLSAAYPEDFCLELVLGRVLVLYKLGNLKEAATELQHAAERFPHALKYLTAKTIKKPKIDPMGFAIGGKDQAWMYRESSRQFWESTPGALQWAADTAGGRKGWKSIIPGG